MSDSSTGVPFKLNVRPDTLDFRDLMFVPTLTEVPTKIPLKDYTDVAVPILDQGREGACTGFGLATVVHYLLRRRRVVPDDLEVSPRMLYEMAKRYDEWPGADYDGSSLRGAMKGWHRHGVCARELWPHDPAVKDSALSDKRAQDAANRPLGAYFRVNHKDIVAMHCAISEVGVLYASLNVHSGWTRVNLKNGEIPYDPGAKDFKILGGHALAIVAYDDGGIWVQNSWGPKWGQRGFAKLSYDDWLDNGYDLWVARLGVPVRLKQRQAMAASTATSTAHTAEGYSYHELRPHIISTGNNGKLRVGGRYGTTEEDVRAIVTEDLPRITAKWTKKRILLYAHGGLVNEESSVQRLAEYRKVLLENEVYPLSFIWKTDMWTTLSNVLKDVAGRRRPEATVGSAMDFMLDRLDDALEPLARSLTGKLQWDEMKENAQLATTSQEGGARLVADLLAGLVAKDSAYELHVLGHSAGSIYMGPLVQYLTGKGALASGPFEDRPAEGLGLTLRTCTMWAPACTMELFDQCYAPAIAADRIRNFGLFTLSPKAELDDNCAGIYNKSLLYLVSNAFETLPRIPLFRDGVPLLGMAKFVEPSSNDPWREYKLKASRNLRKLIKDGRIDWVQTPNAESVGRTRYSRATKHGEFDDELATVSSALNRIAGGAKSKDGAELEFQSTAQSTSSRRKYVLAV